VRIARRYVPWGLLIGLMALAGLSVAVAIDNTGPLKFPRVKMLNQSEMPGAWHPIRFPRTNPPVTCGGHTYAVPSLSVRQHVAYGGPDDTIFVEQFAAPSDPKRLYDHSTEIYSLCSTTGIAHAGGELASIKTVFRSHLLSLYIFSELNNGQSSIEVLGLALAEHGVLEAAVLRPSETSSDVVRVTPSLVLEAIFQGDPGALSGLPHNSLG
jgi:hypothetical protein